MKPKMFQQLVTSLKEGGAILRGKKAPSRKTTLHWPDAHGMRGRLIGRKVE